MVLKGVMTIELTDAATGAVETVTEENMRPETVSRAESADATEKTEKT